MRYPGVERLVGSLPVAEVLSATAIERVIVMGLPDRPDAPGDALLDTRAFVCPQWMDGRLTLGDHAGPGRARGAVRGTQPDALLRRPLREGLPVHFPEWGMRRGVNGVPSSGPRASARWPARRLPAGTV